MKWRTPLAALAIALAIALTAAQGAIADTSKFCRPIRNDNLPALRKLIVSHGALARDPEGNSPLIYAAAAGSAASMRMLLDDGADPNVPNKAGVTPLMVSAGDLAKVKLLLAHGAKVNARANSGRSALQCAVY